MPICSAQVEVLTQIPESNLVPAARYSRFARHGLGINDLDDGPQLFDVEIQFLLQHLEVATNVVAEADNWAEPLRRVGGVDWEGEDGLEGLLHLALGDEVGLAEAVGLGVWLGALEECPIHELGGVDHPAVVRIDRG
jgi:hypothetical protein